jgi:hypothetical protein
VLDLHQAGRSATEAMRFVAFAVLPVRFLHSAFSELFHALLFLLSKVYVFTIHAGTFHRYFIR